jgi:DNA-binding response OmpR family regulator
MPKILLVENSQETAHNIKSYLELEGRDVITSYDGEK